MRTNTSIAKAAHLNPLIGGFGRHSADESSTRPPSSRQRHRQSTGSSHAGGSAWLDLRTACAARLLSLLVLLTGPAAVRSQSIYEPYTFTVLAGIPGAAGSADGMRSDARFRNPLGVALDGAGNVFVADQGNGIRKVTPEGVVTTVPGAVGGSDLAVDRTGNVYVAYGTTIRKVTPEGKVSTLAGLADTEGANDGTGSDARFSRPSGVAIDGANNAYVADTGNGKIRKVTSAGVVITLAAGFKSPTGVAVDGAGNVYVADTDDHTISKVTPVGEVTTLAGLADERGSDDGIGSAARFWFPRGLAVDGVGNVYIADSGNHTIRKVTPAGVVTTLAGLAPNPGNLNGTGNAARFANPNGVAVDLKGNVYVADLYNNTIRFGLPAVGSPVILAQPQSRTVSATYDGSITFSAEANGTIPLAYQWRKGDIEVTGATNTTYTIANFRPVDAGVYSLVASNILGSASSSNAVLTVQLPYTFTTLAGSAGYGTTDGTGSAARFANPYGVAVDSTGNIYVADTGNNTIRKVTPAGDVTTLAGLAGSEGNADGPGSTARFRNPYGVAVDSVGNVYVADMGNYTIRKVTPAGVVTTLAGRAGSAGASDGTGSDARFYAPFGVAVDSAGNVYVSGAHAIRKVTPAGVVTTLAGLADVATLGVAVDSVGNVYVTDPSTIRKVTPAGVVTTLAGLPGQRGYADGTGSTARFSDPFGVAVDSGGNVYVADVSIDAIRKVSPAGMVTTFAGRAGSTGATDGTGNQARFWFPYGVAVDSSGNVFVADTVNNTIRKVTPKATVTTLAGLANRLGGSTDGIGSDARFRFPHGVAVDSGGNAYVADQHNHTIRKVSPSGETKTLAGLAGSAGSTDGIGSKSRFLLPNGVTVDGEGNVYVADQYNHTIRKVSPSGETKTLAGLAGSAGSADGIGSKSRFLFPNGVTVDGEGNVYVADTDNYTIRKVTSTGVVTTLAGMAGTAGSADGTGMDARFGGDNSGPTGVAVDGAGNVYVADTGNNTIRKITPTGVVTTLAGLAGTAGGRDGTGKAARFGDFSSGNPMGVAVDRSGNVYVADTPNYTIRKVTPAGVVTTLAGLAGYYGSVDGTGSIARFGDLSYAGPLGVAVDSAGILYVSDTYNNTIRKGYPPPLILTSDSGIRFKGSNFSLNLFGPPDKVVIVEVSSDLNSWQPISTNTFAGALSFRDLQSDTFSRRFYRARIP